MLIDLSEHELLRLRGLMHEVIMSQKPNEYTADDILVLKIDEVLGVDE